LEGPRFKKKHLLLRLLETNQLHYMQESRHGPAQLFKSASPGLDDGLRDLGGALVVVVYSL